jgi:hypothetical protein
MVIDIFDNFKAGSSQKIKEFPLFNYLRHSNATATAPNRLGAMVFIVPGFEIEPVPTGVYVIL